jgi:predicted nucleic acid-binding protein
MKKYLIKLVNKDIEILEKQVNSSIDWLKNPINTNAIAWVESNLKTTNAKLELAKNRLKKLEEMEF